MLPLSINMSRPDQPSPLGRLRTGKWWLWWDPCHTTPHTQYPAGAERSGSGGGGQPAPTYSGNHGNTAPSCRAPRTARHLETAGDTAHRVSHLLASPQSTFRVQMQISVLWALSWVDDTIRIIHFLQEMLFSDFRVETTTQSFNQSILKLEHKPDIINYWVQIGQTESSCHWFLSWISQPRQMMTVKVWGCECGGTWSGEVF